ncbi:cytochrome P450 [Streptomyces sp. NPDC056500]|uniref:cytochrome P450 family protein n=1 Tax=Streptomyces sp. NPDC056500 TaxID=3345840 RepID=UPI003689C490
MTADPYPGYAWLRENDPVCPMDDPHVPGRMWLVTRYDDVRACLADRRLGNCAPVNPDPHPPGLSNLDDPEHARLRRLIAAAFTPAAVSRLRDRIARTCAHAVESFAGRGHADLVAEYTRELPVAVVHDLLGIPKAERAPAADVLDMWYRGKFQQPHDEMKLAEVRDYAWRLAAYKRSHPGDDLPTRLIESGALTGDELEVMVMTLIGAGHITTIQLLGTTILRLLGDPGQRAALLGGDIDWSQAINELLRLDSPDHVAEYRYADEDMTIGDTHVGKGDVVLLSLAAANHDPNRFPDPDALDLTRDARPHLAFGHGPHACLGSHLVKLETEIAITTLFGRLPDLTLDIPSDEIDWGYAPTFRGPRALPVTFTPREPATSSSLGNATNQGNLTRQ